MTNSSLARWLHDINLIQPGNSAVLEQNFVAFYLVHLTGLVTTGTSVSASAIVIVNILNRRCSKRWDFSDRFPLYLAISDGLLGVINFTTDHLVLLFTQVYPPKEIGTLISVVLTYFLGYQQLMNAGLAMFTYCKVVRHTHIDFGVAEWKLHFMCFAFLSVVVSVFLPLGGFGCAGYWFLTDVKTTGGKYLSLFISSTGTVGTICTLWSYREIKRAVDKQRRIVAFINLYEGKNSSFNLSTATRCLTTFIYVALFLYIPLMILSWIFGFMFIFNSTVDPITACANVILCNSSGWANAWAYFHNKRIKELGKLKNNKSYFPSGNFDCQLVKAQKLKSEVC